VLELLRRGMEVVRQLDPAGVCARDLRECLLLQIAAQEHEFDQLFAKHAADVDKPEEDVHRGFRAEAEAHIEERRRSMEVGALIVDRHLHLLQKRDVKDLARMAQITLTRRTRESNSSVPSTRGPAASTTVSNRG